MKRYGNLIQRIYDMDNIGEAFKKAARGKSSRREVIEFRNNLSNEIYSIHEDLKNGTYVQGQYRNFKVYIPKERDIQALPFRDRVVQHCINNVLEPIFVKSFYYHSYACIKGKGVHSASRAMSKTIRDNMYYLKADVAKYFKNIDRSILFNILSSKIKCEDTLDLLHTIIFSDMLHIGIPIGNLTSQLFANIYLNEMDRFIKEEMRVMHYFRFMDDFIILGYDKSNLHILLSKISQYIETNLKLEFNNKTIIGKVNNGIDFVGYIHYNGHKRIKPTTFKRIKTKIITMRKSYDRIGYLTDFQVSSINSALGHMCHSDTYRVRKQLIKYFKLKRRVI